MKITHMGDVEYGKGHQIILVGGSNSTQTNGMRNDSKRH